jgi:hypothetical protein
MIQFYDLILNNELVTLNFEDIEDMTISASGNILIQNVDGLFYETEKVLFL